MGGRGRDRRIPEFKDSLVYKEKPCLREKEEERKEGRKGGREGEREGQREGCGHLMPLTGVCALGFEPKLYMG